MDWNAVIDDYLYEFSVIIQEGSISTAAEKLSLSQSALTRHLTALETELGVKLVERSPSGIRATEDGRYAFDVAQDMVRLGDSLTEHFHSEKSPQREREVVVEGLCDSRLLVRCLEDARAHLESLGKAPLVRYLPTHMPQSIEDALISHEADVVLVYRQGAEHLLDDARFRCDKLFDAPVVACVEKSHAIASRGSVTLAELQPYTFARYADADKSAGATAGEFLRICAERHLSPVMHTISCYNLRASNWRHPEDILVFSPDILFFDWLLETRGRTAVPINDLSFEVYAVIRSDDAVAGELIGEARTSVER